MTFQPSLDLSVDFPDAAYAYGNRTDGGTHGVVLTKPHIVELILDLAGYSPDSDLGSRRLLEPACGFGAFVLPAMTRLLQSAGRHGRSVATLGDAITAFDIDKAHVAATRKSVIELLVSHDVSARDARKLAENWIRRGDSLLVPAPKGFDFVVGNPPYIRIEQLAPELQAEYRSRFSTLFDRADIYVAFIERGLSLLSSGGVLSFICADRWILNRYGAPLRKLVTSSHDVLAYVDLHTASPFESDVIAYPSIFVIGREKLKRPVAVLSLESATEADCRAAARVLMDGSPTEGTAVRIDRHSDWFSGDAPWVMSSPGQLSVLRDLESRFPLLEEGGRASVRIGVATGNDSIYIVPTNADIEPDRLVPLVMREDVDHGAVKDAKRCVINTFDAYGTIQLDKFPRLRRYFLQHESVVRGRHVAKKNADGWFRTIDRVYPELVDKPKLLIPDIAGSNEVVLEHGRFLPHHNLYFVLSDTWDLEVLGGLLSSRVALFFVWSYAVKMRGGYLRFQAQYLRRIRVPLPETISTDLSRRIRDAFKARDFVALDELARRAYGLADLPLFAFVDTRK